VSFQAELDRHVLSILRAKHKKKMTMVRLRMAKDMRITSGGWLSKDSAPYMKNAPKSFFLRKEV